MPADHEVPAVGVDGDFEAVEGGAPTRHSHAGARPERRWLTEPAVVFDGIAFDHADLVLAGLLDGEWQRFVADLRRAIAAEPDVQGDGLLSDRDELLAVASTYRRERRLLSGEDLRSWLTDRSLDAEHFTAHLHRVLRLRTAREHLLERAAEHAVDATAIEAALRSEAILSGTLRRCGELLVTWAAAARGQGTLHEPPDLDRAACERANALREQAGAEHAGGLGELDGIDVARRAERLVALEQSLNGFAVAHADDQAIARQFASHRLEWQRVRWQEARLSTVAAGREVALCVRNDGMTLADAAGLAAVAVQRHDRRFSELDGSLGGILLATAPGELGGPFASGDEFLLVWVEERVLPRADDEQLRTLARENLVRDALERYSVGRVSWAGQL